MPSVLELPRRAPFEQAVQPERRGTAKLVFRDSSLDVLRSDNAARVRSVDVPDRSRIQPDLSVLDPYKDGPFARAARMGVEYTVASSRPSWREQSLSR